MAWTELILNFVGQVAWPLVVLILGLYLRKPLVKLLTANGPLKTLNAGPVSAEWAVEDGVAKAKDKTDPHLEEGNQNIPDHANTSAKKPTNNQSKPTDTSSSAATSRSASSREVRLPQRYTMTSQQVNSIAKGLPDDIVELATQDPSEAISRSADELRTELTKLTYPSLYESNLTNLVMLSMAVRQAHVQNLFTAEEYDAAEELVKVDDQLRYSGKSVHVDITTALDYARVCRRLIRAAHGAAKRRKTQQKAEPTPKP